jgi:hypothetical protein
VRIPLAITLALAVSAVGPAESAFAAKKQATRTVKRTRPKQVQRRQVTQQDVNRFLRSPAGKSKLHVYKNQALDAPRSVSNPTGERPFLSLRHKRNGLRTSSRLVKVFSWVGGVVTGAMGAFMTTFFASPSAQDMLANPDTHPAMQAISQGHVLAGALIGAAFAIVPGTLIGMGLKRASKNIDRDAENEAVGRIVNEMQTGSENELPQQHPAVLQQQAAGGGRNNSILDDFFRPGLFGPQQSASDRAAMNDFGGMPDQFGTPGGPP